MLRQVCHSAGSSGPTSGPLSVGYEQRHSMVLSEEAKYTIIPTPTAITKANKASINPWTTVTKHPFLLGPNEVSTWPFKSENLILSTDMAFCITVTGTHVQWQETKWQIARSVRLRAVQYSVHTPHSQSLCTITNDADLCQIDPHTCTLLVSVSSLQLSPHSVPVY